MQQAPGRPELADRPDDTSRRVWRLRLVAVCLGLSALAFLQEPGMIVIDTKVDLAVDPAGWLNRALHVWDPDGTFGQLQNQAYGYLWPMGPFFLLGKLLALPAWVVQRLWWALVLTVACTGVVRLAERLHIGTPGARLLAGVAFALSPRLVTELGPISVEAWPSALAPWVLVPLVGLARGGSVRHAVTRSALVVACAGGVNATAVLAVVPLAGLWLLGLHRARLRIRALLAWGLAVAVATAWWLVPLLLLGRYSPPFLDYIETAPVTTAPTDMTTVLRGASHWHAYLNGAYGPPWSAGWRLATEQPLVVATLVVAGLGLAGLARRGMPQRRFLITGLLVGLALVGLGHVGTIDGLGAQTQRDFLDAAGAPLRNVHKFDVVLRLPLILGLAHLAGLLARAARAADRPDLNPGLPRLLQPVRLRATLVTGTALVAVTAVATPALAGGLPAQGSFREVPGYWHEATSWLDRNLGEDRVLVVPAARFPRYLWGSPSDEVTQPLLESPWAVRSSVPLTPPGTIRLLDAVESALANGEGSAGLADLLARSGVRYLLLRSDLDYGRSGATQPVVVRQALRRSPGITPVRAFGPEVGGGQLPGNFVDHGLDVKVRALEVYEVERPVSQVVAYDAEGLTTVVGGPESLLQIAAAGELSDAPTVLAGDRPEGLTGGPVVLTDGMRRREVAFGQPHDNASATMASDDPAQLGAPARDYLPPWGDDQATTARYLGIESVTASSSWSDAQPLVGGRPAHQPFAAVDGNLATSWRSAPGTAATAQWLQVELTEVQVVREVSLTFDTGADSLPTRITVSTGAQQTVVENPGQSVRVTLPAGHPTRRVRISVNQVFDIRAGFGGVGIAELSIPGVRAERTLAVPAPPDTAAPASVVLTAAPGASPCVFHEGRPICDGGLTRESEDGDRIDRTLSLPIAAGYDVALRVRPRAGGALNALLDGGGDAAVARGVSPTVAASSVGVTHPAARPGAVVDGDPATTWYAAESDQQPWLRLTWPKARRMAGIKLALPPTAAAARPWQVTVIGDGGMRGGVLDDGGSLVFDRPLTTDEITVLISDVVPANSFDPYRRLSRSLPVGVGELTVLPDGPVLRNDPDERITLPCGTGPTIEVGDLRRRTSLVASRRDLVQLREVDAVLCGAGAKDPLPLAGGEVRVVAAASRLATPTRLVLTPDAVVPGSADGSAAGTAGTAGAPSAIQTSVRVDGWAATRRWLHLDPYPGQRVLALRENANAGWEAVADGKRLTPFVVDGWQQGWLVPAGYSGEVVLRFAPDDGYAVALGVGALLLAGITAAAVLPARGTAGPVVALVRRPRRRLLAVVFGGTALLLVGGLAAVAVAVLAAAAVVAGRALEPHLHPPDRRGLHRLRRAVGRWLPVACFAVAGWYAVTVGGHTAPAAQLAAVAAVTALWVSLLRRRRRTGGPFQRWKGRSTT
ncbi:alpha-(1-_3)-arabinofuranosyltransferase [Micromonospora sp. C28SCA-DRY-2]|uniref:alpha-(1->3)-arabinofuranosyltransferase n=1 Tax=Micromonospora sp. C28SCA-DRY-2 TaxID=3059522 RepID=UPI00267448B7|nr:alpha-(1->3)-arabinofuranosyltransferase [Micromonospora sp. C28SCA-DRY-2]MDO3703576.1 alpha-(1->3)-arabinofuranosyltransferase [Micromonospora sp. C28SCA-DRY-2]